MSDSINLPTIVSSKVTALESVGVTRERGAKVIADAMIATKMTIDKYGEEHIEPDHTIRLRAEELRARYTGDLKPDGTVDNRSITINANGISDAVLRELMNKVEGVKEEIRGLKASGRQTGEIIDAQLA